MCGSSFDGIPMPVSEMPMLASLSSPTTRTRIVPPGEVYLIAFSKRFETIWLSRAGSALAQTGSARTSTT